MDYQMTALNTAFNVTAIVNISYYKLAANYIFSGERHDFWEFLYVDRGSVVVTAGNGRFLMNAGELVFHCPCEFHAFQAIGVSDVVVVSFSCGSRDMRRFEKKVLFLHQQEKQCLQALIAEAALSYQYFENDPPRVNMRKKASAPFGSDQLVKTYLEQLFVHICRRDDNIGVEQRVITANQLHHHLQLAQQAKEFLSLHYAEKITLERLAAHLNISVSQLKRVFREQTGATVISYLTALRIGEAKRQIRESNLTFTQIADRVGYESIYYFSNVFKKEAGMSLTEYAKSLKE